MAYFLRLYYFCCFL